MTPELPNLGGWFARDENRQPITKPATCGLCRAPFEQKLLSERFMRVVENHSESAVRHVMAAIPNLMVPVYCPPCERKDMTRHVPEPTSWTITAPRRMTDRERFARNLAQLCAAYNRPTDSETATIFWRALERSLTDDEFEKGVISAVRTEKKWPTPSIIANHARAA